MGLRPGKPRAARCAVPALRALTPPVLGLARKPREPGLRASGVRFVASFAAVVSVLVPSRSLLLRPCARGCAASFGPGKARAGPRAVLDSPPTRRRPFGAPPPARVTPLV